MALDPSSKEGVGFEQQAFTFMDEQQRSGVRMHRKGPVVQIGRDVNDGDGEIEGGGAGMR